MNNWLKLCRCKGTGISPYLQYLKSGIFNHRLHHQSHHTRHLRGAPLFRALHEHLHWLT